MLEHVTDVRARGLALLPDQFQKTGIRALLASWLDEFQAVEAALWQLLDATLDTATGARLAQYGAILGELRGGLSDTAYRAVLRARIHANRSQGRDADLAAMLAIFEVAWGIEDFAPASILVTLEAFPGAGLPPRIAALVRRAVAGGVGAQTVAPVSEDEVFLLASTAEDVEAAAAHGLADTGQTQGGALCGVWE